MHFIHLFLFPCSVATNYSTGQTSLHPTSALTATTGFGEAGVTLKVKDLIKQMMAAKPLCTEILRLLGCFGSFVLPSVSHCAMNKSTPAL